MPPSPKELERAISRLRKHSHPNWVLSFRDLHAAHFRHEKCSPAEFLDRLQQSLERLSSYERLLRLLHVVVKFVFVLGLEGD